MSQSAKALSEQAMQLSPVERMALVEHILDSLDEPDPSMNALWVQETGDRLAAYRRGEIRAVPLSEVLAKSVIKVLNASLADEFKLALDFSDHTHGVFDANAYLASRSGPLLDKLREPAYFKRFFIDAGALCWPN